ncbi:hypothetical protein ACSBR2_031122 [Camellia fascicularis]
MFLSPKLLVPNRALPMSNNHSPPTAQPAICRIWVRRSRRVAEEIREIEWPAFGKVVGTTGVVLGVIAGSSVVLLTVNAVLAELSDRVFAGKGLQDFFG